MNTGVAGSRSVTRGVAGGAGNWLWRRAAARRALGGGGGARDGDTWDDGGGGGGGGGADGGADAGREADTGGGETDLGRGGTDTGRGGTETVRGDRVALDASGAGLGGGRREAGLDGLDGGVNRRVPDVDVDPRESIRLA